MSTKKAQEKWVVPVYNGIHYTNYLISSNGRLVSKSKYSKSNQKIKLEFGEYTEVKPLKCKLGYLTFNIYQTSDKRNLMYHHRLMWESFVCPITKGMVIDHINTEKDDNRLSNLQMITYSENYRKGMTIDKQIKAKKKK
jgi:hypothetical protein